MSLLDLFFVAIVTGFTITAAISDLMTRKLPNWLTVSAFVAGLLMHTVINGLAGLGFSLLGFVTGFCILLVLWLIGGGGGGDVKLMGALGAWLGAGLTLRVFFVSTVLAAMATGAMLLAGMLSRGFGFVQRRYLATGSARPTGREARRLRNQRRRLMPYAVPVALGTWLVLFLAWQSASLPWCGHHPRQIQTVSPRGEGNPEQNHAFLCSRIGRHQSLVRPATAAGWEH